MKILSVALYLKTALPLHHHHRCFLGKLHILSLHTIPVNMTCLPIFGTHYIYVLTLFLHETTSLLYPASITYDEPPLFVAYCILFLACFHVLLLIWSNTFVRAPF